jgi:enoyl-CoA hydratase/carnithine racemase
MSQDTSLTPSAAPSPQHAARVRITMHAHGVADVCLVRSDKMNALDPAMFAALVDAIHQLKQQAGLRAVVLHGEGKAFCAGLDMASFAALGAGHPASNLGPRTHGIANAPQHIALGWRELAVPVIAAVQGAAFGGGLQLALGADIRLLAPDAQMSVMEIKWGLVPDMAGMVLMRSLLRDDVLRELCYSGRVLPAPEAVQLGLGTRICDDPLAEAHQLAQAMAQRSPSALRAAKRLLNQAASTLDQHAAALLQAESDEQSTLMAGANQREAVRANLERRPPQFIDQDEQKAQA